MRRVVITGQGTINSLGNDVPATLEAMREGRCGITDLELRDVDRLSIKIGGQVKNYDPEALFNRQQIALYDRFTQFTLIAAHQALDGSGLSFAGEQATRSGVVLGTAGGGVNTWDENYRSVYEEGKNRVHPFVVPKLMNNAAASHVSMEWNLKGPCFSVATACASSNHAMGLAFQLIRGGAADVMVTGGSEAMLSFGGIKAWEGLRVMSRDACRPFSASALLPSAPASAVRKIRKGNSANRLLKEMALARIMPSCCRNRRAVSSGRTDRSRRRWKRGWSRQALGWAECSSTR